MTSDAERGQIALPVDAMILQELELITSAGCPVTSFPSLLALVAGGRFDPKRLVSRTVPTRTLLIQPQQVRSG